jgi:hypothetical protein
MAVDFQEVRRIPFASVLSYLHIPFRKRSDTELVAQCPFPSHTSKKHEWTLAISTEKLKFFCHSETCRAASNKPKGGDVIDFIQLLENHPTPLCAAKRLAEIFALDGHTASVPLTPSKPSNPPLAFELKNLQHGHPFILGRGITAETAKEFGVGFFPGKGSMANRICFPLYEVQVPAKANPSDGDRFAGVPVLIGYAGRTTLDVSPENPKWKLPNGLHRTFLYGIERCDPSKPLIICESCWGVLWFFQNGCQAAALLGSSLTPEQEALLEPYAEVRICMDDDSAGREAAEKIAARLKTSHKVSKAYLRG